MKTEIERDDSVPAPDAPQLLAGYLTAEQCAAQLHVSVRTLYRWIANGVGPARVKVGWAVYFRPASVEQWLLAREQQGRRPPRAHRRTRARAS